MCRLRLSRLFCLLCALSVFFGSFGLNVSAASDSENLIDSDLRNWLITPNFSNTTSVTGNATTQIVVIKSALFGDNTYKMASGELYDITSSYSSGDKYTLSFNFVNPDNYIGGGIGILGSAAFLEYDSVLAIGLGSYNNNSVAFVEDCVFYITSENYEDYIDSTVKYSFEMPSGVVNPCIYIAFTCIVPESDLNQSCWLAFQNFSLVNESQLKEDSFFSRLFEWFQEKFDAIGESFSNLGNKLTELKDGFVSKISELGDSIGSFFDNLFNKISRFFHDLKWEIVGGSCDDSECLKIPHTSLADKITNKLAELKQSVIDLGNNILDGIKRLFVPDEQFISTWKEEMEILLQERLGIIWDAGDFFIALIQTIGDLLTTTADDIHYELPEMVVELNGQTYTLWQAQQVDFSFLEKNAFFAMLYKLYKAVLNVFLGIPLLNYAKKEMDATLHN